MTLLGRGFENKMFSVHVQAPKLDAGTRRRRFSEEEIGVSPPNETTPIYVTLKNYVNT